MSFWRGKKTTPPPPVRTSSPKAPDYERRIVELETRMAKVVEVLSEVAEDTAINRNTILKLLRLLKEKP